MSEDAPPPEAAAADSSTSSSDKQFTHYIRERDQARELATEREKQCNAVKSKNYELSKKIEELEEQIKELKKNKPNKTNTGGTKKQGNGAKNGTAKSQHQAKNKNVTREEKASKAPKKGTTHPIIPGKEQLAEDSVLFYTEVATTCPHIKLSVVRNAEKLFLEGDVNGDGLIDVEELDNLFTRHMALYTRKQVEDILQSVDADGSLTLDFLEVVDVMNQLDTGQKTTLPSNAVQKDAKGTAICSIQ